MEFSSSTYIRSNFANYLHSIIPLKLFMKSHSIRSWGVSGGGHVATSTVSPRRRRDMWCWLDNNSRERTSVSGALGWGGWDMSNAGAAADSTTVHSRWRSLLIFPVCVFVLLHPLKISGVVSVTRARSLMSRRKTMEAVSTAGCCADISAAVVLGLLICVAGKVYNQAFSKMPNAL